MKLFHVIVQHDFYVLANSTEAARATADTVITENMEKPVESVAIETRRLTDVSERWREQAPYVADDIVGYDPVAEDTVGVLFSRLYKDKPLPAKTK